MKTPLSDYPKNLAQRSNMPENLHVEFYPGLLPNKLLLVIEHLSIYSGVNIFRRAVPHISAISFLSNVTT